MEWRRKLLSVSLDTAEKGRRLGCGSSRSKKQRTGKSMMRSIHVFQRVVPCEQNLVSSTKTQARLTWCLFYYMLMIIRSPSSASPWKCPPFLLSLHPTLLLSIPQAHFHCPLRKLCNNFPSKTITQWVPILLLLLLFHIFLVHLLFFSSFIFK